MVETIANLPQEKMKVFAGHAAERIEPVLGIAPEPLDPVEMVPSFGPTFLLADHHMIPLDAQRTVRMPVIGIVQTARLGMGANQSGDLIPPTRNRKHAHLAVALQDPQHDDFAGRSPTPLPPPDPANRGLVALDHAAEGFAKFFDIRAASAGQSIETLDRGSARRSPESLPVDRNSQDEHLQQPTLRGFRQMDRRPCGLPRIPPTAGLALEPSIGQCVRSGVTTLITSSHVQTSVNLVRFG